MSGIGLKLVYFIELNGLYYQKFYTYLSAQLGKDVYVVFFASEIDEASCLEFQPELLQDFA